MTVLRSALLTGLPDDEMQRLSPYLQLVEMTTAQTLVQRGEPIEYVWFPHDAVTSTLVDSPEGTTIEVGLMGMEGMVGLSTLFGRTISNSTVIVKIAGHGTRMRAEDFRTHVVETRSGLYRRLLRYADDFMALIAQTAACNSLHDVNERLIRWILMTHDRVQRSSMPLTQEFLAYMLGVRRASVSIAAAALQRRGLIRYSRGHLEIIDRTGMEQYACACYEIVRTIMDSPDVRASEQA